MRQAIPHDWHGSPLAWQALLRCHAGLPLFERHAASDLQGRRRARVVSWLIAESLIEPSPRRWGLPTVTPLGLAAIKGEPRVNGWASDFEKVRAMRAQGLTVPVIAERLGRTKSATRKMIYRVRRREALAALMASPTRAGADASLIGRVLDSQAGSGKHAQ